MSDRSENSCNSIYDGGEARKRVGRTGPDITMSWFTSGFDWFRNIIDDAKMDLNDNSFEDDCDEYEKKIHIPPDPVEERNPTAVYYKLFPDLVEIMPEGKNDDGTGIGASPDNSSSRDDDTKQSAGRRRLPRPPPKNIAEMDDHETYNFFKDTGMKKRTRTRSSIPSNYRRDFSRRNLGGGACSRFCRYFPRQDGGIAIPVSTTA